MSPLSSPLSPHEHMPMQTGLHIGPHIGPGRGGGVVAVGPMAYGFRAPRNTIRKDMKRDKSVVGTTQRKTLNRSNSQPTLARIAI